MFIHCGLNAIKTANKLYIHRNTFNYRLHKFIALTGLDIRDYRHALYFELASRLLKTK
jgi:carbohydrate diacid regulator